MVKLCAMQEPSSGQATPGTMTDGSSRARHLSSDLELGIAAQRQETRSGAAPGSPRQGRWGRAQQGMFQGWQSFKGFLLAVCSSRERPLHFIKLQIPSPSGVLHDCLVFMFHSQNNLKWQM